MNRNVTVVFSVLSAWAMSAYGVQPSPDYEHLKPLEWQIGDWVSEYQAASDAGPIKKGDTVTVRFSLRWSPDRSFIVNNSLTEVGGKRVATGLEIISWDSEKSMVSHSYHGSWGTGHGAWTKVGDKAELEWTIKGQHGAFTGKSYVTRGAESWEWQIREQTHDGKVMPDMPLATFRRKTGAPAGDLWSAYQKAAAGKWVGEGKLLWDIPQYQASKDDSFKLQLSLEAETKGRVLLGNQDFQIDSKSLNLQACILAVWDPDSQQVRLFAFWGDGYVEELLLARQKGKTFFGTYVAKAPGLPTERWRMCLRFPDRDSYEYKFLSGPHKGKVLSSWKREKK